MRSFRASALALVVALVLLVTIAVPNAVASTREEPAVKIETTGLLIQKPGEGIELCTGGVELSLPPNCDGLAVTGVRFESISRTVRVDSAAGVRWADWAVVRGQLRGRTLRVISVSPIRALDPAKAASSEFSAPDATCPTTGNPGVQPWEAQTFRDQLAADFPTTYAGGWIDQHGVVVVRFTDAPGTYDEQLAARFGGAFCIEGGRFTLAQLQDVFARFGAELPALTTKYDRRFVTGEVNQFENHVDLVLDMPPPAAMRAELRRRLGDALHVTSTAQVIDRT
jgi:hypothetical protein